MKKDNRNGLMIWLQDDDETRKAIHFIRFGSSHIRHQRVVSDFSAKNTKGTRHKRGRKLSQQKTRSRDISPKDHF